MISVLLPAYNCRQWIEESLRSVASQTLPPDEILVADDASTDGTADFVEALAIPGVRLLRSERNMGISRQLNRMIGEAKGRYLARMDGDDIAHPDKFRIQIEEMRRSGVGIIGSWARRFGAVDTLHRFATDDERLKGGLLFSVPFCHPSVVIDRDRVATDLGYDPDFDLAEDYHMWLRLRHSTRYANIPRVLLNWRMHDRNAGTSSTTAPHQQRLSSTLRKGLLRDYGIECAPELFEALDRRVLAHVCSRSELATYLEALMVLYRHPAERIGCSSETMGSILVEQWDLACAFSAWEGTGVALDWARGRRRLGAGVPARNLLKFALKGVAGKASTKRQAGRG